MTALTIHDRRLDGQGLAFDLIDILRLAGNDAETSTWRCHDVECIGGSSAALHRAAREGSTLAGGQLLSLADNLQQVIDGTFTAHRPGEFDPWLMIRAVDSSLYVVVTEEAPLLEAVRRRFRNVRNSPPELAWMPPARHARPRRRLRSFRAMFFFCFFICAPVAGLLGFSLAFSVGMLSFGDGPNRGPIALLGLITEFPVPTDEPLSLVLILNTTIWAACFSLLLAWLLTDQPRRNRGTCVRDGSSHGSRHAGTSHGGQGED